MKHAQNIEAFQCEFLGKYPFWHNENLLVEDSVFPVAGRTAIWYSKNVKVLNTKVDAPKMFRECDNIYVENVQFSDAGETGWNCRDAQLRNVAAKNWRNTAVAYWGLTKRMICWLPRKRLYELANFLKLWA